MTHNAIKTEEHVKQLSSLFDVTSLAIFLISCSDVCFLKMHSTTAEFCKVEGRENQYQQVYINCQFSTIT